MSEHRRETQRRARRHGTGGRSRSTSGGTRCGGGISRRAFLRSAGGAGTIALAGCSGTRDGAGGAGASTGTSGGSGSPSDADSMTIFHAGSLEAPFSAAESRFEETYDVEVNREAKGSVGSTKKITEQGRRADVLGVSDFRLLRDVLLPEYGSWYGIVTTNAMSIQYREDSPGADDIRTGNWWDVLSRDDVTIGHSDPAIDPGGYRAVMTQQLGAEAFDGSKLYDQATYEALRENSTVPTGTETNLEGQLESGNLDYAIYYRSISTTSELPSIDLQPEVDLSRAQPTYARHYAKAEVETDSGTYTGAPIAYGITVPGVADAPELGAKWIEFVIDGAGQQILEDEGFVPVDPAVVSASGQDSVPPNVLEHATVKSSLGPLNL